MVAGEGVLLDLSVRGCRISSDRSVTRGTELQLRCVLPGHDQESPVEVERAVVQWTREGIEFGVEFLQLAVEAPERIRRYARTLETGPSH